MHLNVNVPEGISLLWIGGDFTLFFGYVHVYEHEHEHEHDHVHVVVVCLVYGTAPLSPQWNKGERRDSLESPCHQRLNRFGLSG